MWRRPILYRGVGHGLEKMALGSTCEWCVSDTVDHFVLYGQLGLHAIYLPLITADAAAAAVLSRRERADVSV
jgi:hypothetical protein